MLMLMLMLMHAGCSGGELESPLRGGPTCAVRAGRDPVASSASTPDTSQDAATDQDVLILASLEQGPTTPSTQPDGTAIEYSPLTLTIDGNDLEDRESLIVVPFLGPSPEDEPEPRELVLDDRAVSSQCNGQYPPPRGRGYVELQDALGAW